MFKIYDKQAIKTMSQYSDFSHEITILLTTNENYLNVP